LIETYHELLFDRFFGKVIEKRDQIRAVNGAGLWKSNVRVHNIELKEFIGKGEKEFMTKLLEAKESLIKKVQMVIE